MSIIGPRPGLWNQDVLTAERDKYGANDVKPGLTGWAQINGRDELEIPEKAKLDGYYVQNMGFKMDAKVLSNTISRSSNHEFIFSFLNNSESSPQKTKQLVSIFMYSLKKELSFSDVARSEMSVMFERTWL